MTDTASPLAPPIPTDPPPLKGVRLAATAAGIRAAGGADLMAMVFDHPAAVAGTFTRSLCPSAPVDHCRRHLPRGEARALVANAGNANAFTGARGEEAVRATAEAAARAFACPPETVFLASTGVIGEPLDGRRVADALAALGGRPRDDGWLDAARAIMTTDTWPKTATRAARIDGAEVRINGIAKGAGMIAPDMATMLAFLATDAAIAAGALQAMVSEGVETSFNAITVDGDTSTSDTVLLFATGAAEGAPRIENARDERLAGFRAALFDLMRDLAHQIVRDGEGARKIVEIGISGAASDAAAKIIAMAIANSPLVKTAIAGEDPNWGRIVMAVGKAGQAADRDRLAIRLGGVSVARDGERDPDYREADGRAAMRGEKVDIGVDVGVGNGRATVWTCDLTRDYVAINGDYRS